jgi:hypothetical protein
LFKRQSLLSAIQGFKGFFDPRLNIFDWWRDRVLEVRITTERVQSPGCLIIMRHDAKTSGSTFVHISTGNPVLPHAPVVSRHSISQTLEVFYDLLESRGEIRFDPTVGFREFLDVTSVAWAYRFIDEYRSAQGEVCLCRLLLSRVNGGINYPS